jgi:hypothetical protein
MDKVFFKLTYIFLFISNLMFAQQNSFFRAYGDSTGDMNAIAVEKTPDNCYLSLAGFGNGGILIKTDSIGDLIWSRQFQMNTDDHFTDMIVTKDSNIVLLGILSLGGHTTYLLIKMNLLGDTIWNKRVHFNDYVWPKSIKQSIDNGLIITGWTKLQGNTELDMVVSKLDSIGNIEWSNVYSGFSAPIRNIIELPDSSIVGVMEDPAGVIKLSKSGNFLWCNRFNFTDHLFGLYEIKILNDGFLLIGLGNNVIIGKTLVIIKTEVV